MAEKPINKLFEEIEKSASEGKEIDLADIDVDSKEPEIPLPARPNRAKAKWGRVHPVIGEVLVSLFSTDKPTRRMSFLFFFSLVGIVAVVIIGGLRYRDYLVQRRLSRGEHTAIGDFMLKNADNAKRRFSHFPLGNFVFQFRREPGSPALPRGVSNMAEVEIVAECDSKPTCLYLEEKIAEVRDRVAGALIDLDRDEFFSKNGKNHVRSQMTDAVNAWLPKGKVTNMYFTHAIAN